MKASVFVHTTPGKSPHVVAARRLPGVKSTDVCWGLPDIITPVEAADAKAPQEFVVSETQTLAGVNETGTRLVSEQ